MVASVASGTMYVQEGIAGPPIVHDGRVYFTQADGTLTVLRLDSGQVIQRRGLPDEISRIASCDAGLIAMGWDGSYLLDWATLDTIWSTRGAWNAQPVGDDLLVFSDFYESAWAVDLATGLERWARDNNVYQATVVDGAAMLVLYEQQRYGPDTVSVEKINAQTGETLTATVLADAEHPNRYRFAFDGQTIFAVQTIFRDATRTPEELQALAVGSSGGWTPAGTVTHPSDRKELLQIGDQCFGENGHPITLPAERTLSWPETSSRYHTVAFELPDGWLIDETINMGHSEAGRLRYEAIETSWRIVIPHIQTSHHIQSATAADDVLLIATCLGQLECLDRATGRSRWMYISQWSHVILSTSGGAGLYLSMIVGEFDRQRTSISKRSPSRVVPADLDWTTLNDTELLALAAPPSATTIQDPHTFDPYAEYRPALAAMRVAPIVLAGIALIAGWWIRRLQARRAACASLTAASLFILPIPALSYFGMVSAASSKALVIEMILLAFIVAAFTIRALQNRIGYIAPAFACTAVAVSLWWAYPFASHLLRG